jgi:hypothetical protein
MFRCTISGGAISTLTFNRVSTPIADVFPVARSCPRSRPRFPGQKRPKREHRYPLFLLEHLPAVGIDVGDITGLLIPPHQIPDRCLKPEVVPKCKR